jgi:hypothetical protein
VPQRFSIEGATMTLPFATAGPLLAARATRAQGESPRGDDPGVLAWVEGTRRGTALRVVVGRAWPGLAPALRSAVGDAGVALLADGSGGNDALHSPTLRAQGPPAPPQHPPLLLAERLPAPDILRLVQRLNE